MQKHDAIARREKVSFGDVEEREDPDGSCGGLQGRDAAHLVFGLEEPHWRLGGLLNERAPLR